MLTIETKVLHFCNDSMLDVAATDFLVWILDKNSSEKYERLMFFN